MKPIKAHKGILSEDGLSYKCPQPNLGSIQRMFDEFRDCMEKSLKPVGMTMDICSTHPVWSGEMDKFDLTCLDKISFSLTMVKYT